MGTNESIAVELLDHFRLCSNGSPVEVPPHSATVIAFLAVYDRPVRRAIVAEALWPSLHESRALASLRSALYRIRLDVVAPVGDALSLAPRVQVDLRDAIDVARQIHRSDLVPRQVEEVTELLARELLPEIDGIWIEPEREHFRHLRLSALAVLARRLTAVGRLADAVEVAQRCTTVEPTSEAAACVLINALVAEGNEALAFREFTAFRQRLWRDLRLRPTRAFDDLRGDAAVTSPRRRSDARVTAR